MKQIWHDLLFAHWPIPAATMRPLVPNQLDLDTFDDRAWVGVVPFHMSGIRRRGLPAIPGLSRFPELNVRTYVTHGGKPGVYFFSLDAANLPAVWAARRFYHLPYFHAAMSSREAGGDIHYFSRRQRRLGRISRTATVQSRQVQLRQQWIARTLADRALLPLHTHKEEVYRGEIHHQPWPLQDAEAELEINTVAAACRVLRCRMTRRCCISRASLRS